MNPTEGLTQVLPMVRRVWNDSSDLTSPFGLHLEGDGTAISAGARNWYSFFITCHADSVSIDRLSDALKVLQSRIEQVVKSPVTLTLIPRPATGNSTNGTH
ncbi:MAG: hypothetical protein ACKVZJ_10835 [Phycisphaerales bacterium]